MYQFLAPYHPHCNITSCSTLTGRYHVVETISSVTALDLIAPGRDDGIAIDSEMACAVAPIAIYGIGSGWRCKKAGYE